MSRLLARMRGAARLDAATYEEVEADPAALRQAFAIVAAASASSALGTALALSRFEFDARHTALQVLVSALLPFVIWLGGTTLSYMAGASFFRGPETETDFAELLRTSGFAFTPGLLLGLAGTLPVAFGITLAWLLRLWILCGAIVAIRQALDFTTLRALGTFGTAALLLWLLIWGLAAAPLPL